MTIRSTVKKAAWDYCNHLNISFNSSLVLLTKLAVYEEINIKVKNHQTEPTIRPANERGETSQPCPINVDIANQNEFNRLNSLTVVV